MVALQLLDYRSLIPWLVLALAIPPGFCCSRKESGTLRRNPDVVDRKTFVEKLTDLPVLGWSGLTFYHEKLFVSSNHGLLEIQAGTLNCVYRWRANDNIGGPWRDLVNDALWLVHEEPFALTRHDGQGWHQVSVPTPRKGYYSRDDLLRGFRGYSGKNHFWLVGANTAWTWNVRKNSWDVEKLPAVPSMSVIIGVVLLSRGPLYVVEEAQETQSLSTFRKRYVAYHAPPAWRRTPLGEFAYIEEMVVVGDVVYLRSSDYKLVRVTGPKAEVVQTMGPCEAICATGAGTLLVSLRGKGIYVLQGESWAKRFPYPHPGEEGEYETFLAQGDSAVAFGRTPSVVYRFGRFIQNGGPLLWVSEAGVLKPVSLEEK